jgi:hypothetical protein
VAYNALKFTGSRYPHSYAFYAEMRLNRRSQVEGQWLSSHTLTVSRFNCSTETALFHHRVLTTWIRDVILSMLLILLLENHMLPSSEILFEFETTGKSTSDSLHDKLTE